MTEDTDMTDDDFPDFTSPRISLTPKEPHGWRPIETAPDDSEDEYLVWDGYVMHTAAVMWREDGKPVWFNGDVRVDATHWMPLPPPPAKEPRA